MVAERLTLDEAVRRAMANNPTTQQAVAGILRAEAILQQVESGTRPSVGAAFSTAVIGPVQSFDGDALTPRTQTFTGLSVAVPLLTPARWARGQAGDQVTVAQRESDNVRTQVAVATAECLPDGHHVSAGARAQRARP